MSVMEVMMMMMMVDIFFEDGASSLFLGSRQKTLGAPVTQQLHRRQPEICMFIKITLHFAAVSSSSSSSSSSPLVVYPKCHTGMSE